jgi:hypothetical protein
VGPWKSLKYVKKKYRKDYDKCVIIQKFRDGIQNKGTGNESYISIGEIIFNKIINFNFHVVIKDFLRNTTYPKI